MFGDGPGKGTADDGISTGWVCCNLGDVSGVVVKGGDLDASEVEVVSKKDQERILEDEEDEYKNPADDDFTYRGFGDETGGQRIVVQMFTEEKRLEMDLEGMWEARLKRREAKASKQSRTVDFDPDEGTDADADADAGFQNSRVEGEMYPEDKIEGRYEPYGSRRYASV